MIVSEQRANLRSDAQSNLWRILQAAAEIFAEHGGEATVAAVAERADVGTATIFRRFPTKDDLLAAVLEDQLQQLAEHARQAAAVEPPVEALRQVMLVSMQDHLKNRLVSEAMGSGLLRRPRLRELFAEITAAKQMALARAQESGEIRTDVTVTDLVVFMAALAAFGRRLDATASDAWRRCLGIFLDGLGVEGAQPLPQPPLTESQLATVRGESSPAAR